MAKNKTNSSSPSRAIYAGTFDPITNGHVDLIQRASGTFEEITILVAHSGKKKPLFSAEERMALIQNCFKDQSRIKVTIYDGLLVNYAKANEINVILRGLRGVSDFDYEFQMATMNRRMFPDLQTFFLMSSEKFFFINSTLVKEVIAHGGDVSELVPRHVEKALKERFQ